MPDFSVRSTQHEDMDDLNCAGEIVDQALRELEFINTWLGGNQVTIASLQALLKNHVIRNEITIADLGCGGGDMLGLINTWAKKKKLIVKLTGIDANPNIIAFAKKNLKDQDNVKFHVLDIFSEQFKQMKFDVVIGTLFFHHFTKAQLIQFFTQLKNQVQLGIIINDIHRHPLAYYSIKYLTQAFSKSPMVQSDAPLSVLRAFKKHELESTLKRAGLSNYEIQWRWAFRWQTIVKTSS